MTIILYESINRKLASMLSFCDDMICNALFFMIIYIRFVFYIFLNLRLFKLLKNELTMY